MPRRTVLFLAAVLLAAGAIALQITWRQSELNRAYIGKYENVSLRELTGFTLPDTRPALSFVPEWSRKLDGQPVRVSGDVARAQYFGEGAAVDLVVSFQRPRDLRIEDRVGLRLPEGASLAVPNGSAIAVYGTLRLNEPGRSGHVFIVDVDRIEDSGDRNTVLFPAVASPPPPRRDYKPLIALITMSLLAAAAILLAVWHVLRQRDQSRRAHRLCHNLCLSCGYDLRGTCGRCPECGTPVRQAPAAALPGRGSG